jgi:hypothetical protein
MKKASGRIFPFLGFAFTGLTLSILMGYENKPKESPLHIEDRGKNAADAAMRTLGFLTDVIDSQSFASLGFRSLKEVEIATLGAPIRIFRLRCDLMTRPFATGNSRVRGFSFSNSILYPLVVDGMVRASFMVDSIPNENIKSRGDWVVSEIGNAELARTVTSTLQMHTGISRLPESSYSVGEVPNLGEVFLFYSSRFGEMVVPIKTGSASSCPLGVPGEAVPLESALKSFAKCKTLPKSCSM